MKIARRVWVIVLAALLLGLIVGYGLLARRTATPRVLMRRDARDIPPLLGSAALTSYDPYFNRVNFTREVMFSPTNSPRAETKAH